MYGCAVTPMSCCTAYVIADHLNSVSGDAWPSVERIANKLCVSTKTVRRSIRELERHGLLKVTRPTGRKRTNRYRPNLPLSAPEVRSKGDRPDIPGQKSGQPRPENADMDVTQSYLENLPKSYCNPATEKEDIPLRDQGTYELEIIRRLGADGAEILDQLGLENPKALTALCRAQKGGHLSDQDLKAVISSVLPLPSR